jgi:hypothetical protein
MTKIAIQVMLILSICSFNGFSQTLFVPGGFTTSGVGTSSNSNVGIGTSSPSGLLHLATPSTANWWGSWNYGINLVIDGPHHNSIGFLDTNSSNPFAITNVTGTLTVSSMPPLGNTTTAPTNLLAIVNSGNVGIGTITPTGLLHLRTLSTTNYWSSYNYGANLVIDGPHHNSIGFLDAGSSNPFAITNVSGTLMFSKMPALGNTTTAPTNLIAILSNGNVGIGNSSPDAKLAVSGQVHAQEVKVSVTVPGPDYVFEKDYKLPTLEELKAYIDQNKHLPEVPSAAEMEKNGVLLGEMNMLLLKKVEELSLYVIELERRLKKLEVSKIRK